MIKADKISQDLLDELTQCINQFKNLNEENVFSKEFNKKLDNLYFSFCKALDARNETHYKAVGLSQISESEIQSKLAELKVSFKNSVQIGNSFSPNPETECILNTALELMENICKKKFPGN